MGETIISTAISRKRNYGIDMLRIVAMYFVMILHILGHGGILSQVTFGSANYSVSWLLEIVAYCAVDCFVIISGFVGICSEHNYSNVVILWLQTLIYSVLFYLGYSAFTGSFSSTELVKSFMPITSTEYWFFTAYFGMYLFMPLLNKAVLTMSEHLLKRSLVIILVFFSVFSMIDGDIFNLNSGNSVLWFIALYITGAYLKRFNLFSKIPKRRLILIIVFVILCTWFSKVILDYATITILGEARFGNVLIKYSSPTILLVSVLMVVIFSGINVTKCTVVLKKVTPLTFGAYLIQDNPYVRELLISNRFINLVSLNPGMLIFFVLGCGLICLLVGFVLDFCRFKLFELLKIKKNLEIIGQKVNARFLL